MKILFTSAGRRVELMQHFHRAAEEEQVSLAIYGADMDNYAPALMFCDQAVIVPRIRSEEYIPSLLKLCSEEKIDALIPTIDTDLMILAKNRERFEEIGTRVFIGDPEKIAICRDKRFTADYFRSLGLKSPAPVDDVESYEGGFPAFIKPKDGSSSIFAYRADDEETLRNYANQVPDYIIQPYVSGTEYTIDAFCDYSGEPVYITPRIRLAVRAGEVLKTKITQDDTIIAEAKTILTDFKPRGPITLQLIRQEATGDDYYIEINPRFGGGSPITMMAGADSAKACIRILAGKPVCYQEKAAIDGAIYSRYDQTIRVK